MADSQILSELVDITVNSYQDGLDKEDKTQLKQDVIEKALAKAKQSGLTPDEIVNIEKTLQDVLDNSGAKSIDEFKAELSDKVFKSVNINLDTNSTEVLNDLVNTALDTLQNVDITNIEESNEAIVEATIQKAQQNGVSQEDLSKIEQSVRKALESVDSTDTLKTNLINELTPVIQSSTINFTNNLLQANTEVEQFNSVMQNNPSTQENVVFKNIEETINFNVNFNSQNSQEKTLEDVEKTKVDLVIEEKVEEKTNEVIEEVVEELVVLDTTPPIAPIIIFNDIGQSHSDGLTANNSVTVLGLESGASWEYSTDAGTTWSDGSGSSFDVTTDGTYAIGDIQVKQTDSAGNESEVGSSESAIEFDTVGVASPVNFALTTDSGSSNSDGISKNEAITVNVTSLNATSWEYSTDGGTTWTTGTASSFNLPSEKTYAIDDIQVRTKGTTDTAGNESLAVKNSSAITFDSTAPTGHSLSIANDTGSDTSDNITNDETINVTGIESGATWQYSTDGGSNWSDGTGTSFELSVDKIYNQNDIQVRQTDLAGNTSLGQGNSTAITLDTTGDGTSSTLALNSDAGTSNSDNTTSNGQLDVTFESSVTSWEYSTDGGTTWSDGTGTGTSVNFTLVEGTYNQNDIQAREKGITEDTAGNAGNVSKNSSAITVDTTASSITVSSVDISADSGASSSDFVTNTASQTISATLSSALVSGDKLYGSVDNGSNWIDISDKVSDTAISWDTATLSGNSSIVFKITDNAGNETANQATTSYTLDTTAPTTTITDAAYDAANDKITLTGTNFDTLLESSEDDTTDIKDRLDWSKISWDVDGDGGAVDFTNFTIDSAKVVSGTSLEIVANSTSAIFLESQTGYDPLDTDDVLEVSAGFTKDSAGNASTTDAYTTSYGFSGDVNNVVFDMVGGTSSDHSDRTFDANTSYTIYIVVDSTTPELKTDANSGNGTWGKWTGAKNLSTDDKIILVGESDITDFAADGGGFFNKWKTAGSTIEVQLNPGGTLFNFPDVDNYVSRQTDIMDGTGFIPGSVFTGLTVNSVYLTTMPNGVMTSQGLA